MLNEMRLTGSCSIRRLIVLDPVNESSKLEVGVRELGQICLD